MGLRYCQTFHIRYDECDLYEHLNNAVYVRYMQEAALGASAEAGYDKGRYAELGTGWIVRDTHIEFLQPVGYGDSVDVTTWVEDVRRVQSRRNYEFTHTNTQELVAKAYSNWVYITRATGKLMTVPPEIRQAYLPNPSETITRPEKFPTLPPRPVGAYTTQRRVQWRDIDGNQHMNNAAYLNYIEDVGTDVMAHFGWDLERLFQTGIAVVLRRCSDTISTTHYIYRHA